MNWTAFAKKNWLWLLIGALVLIWVITTNWFQQKAGSLWKLLLFLAAAAITIFTVFVVLIEIVELPVLIVIAACILVAGLLWKLWGWLSGSSSTPGTVTGAAGAGAASQSAPTAPVDSDPFDSPQSTNNGLLSFPPGTVDNGDGTVTLPDGSIQQNTSG